MTAKSHEALFFLVFMGFNSGPKRRTEETGACDDLNKQEDKDGTKVR